MADVLVVDDDPDIRGMLAFVLEDEGHQVRVAADGEAGLRAIEDYAPDCMVVDVMMPGMDGFAMLRARRQRSLAPLSRVLILTCRTNERDYVRGWELGADEYLTKPFDPGAVADMVAALLVAAPAELARRRVAELQKAELLDRLETAFTRR
jgi:DNA-binding response OmpR family regulator